MSTGTMLKMAFKDSDTTPKAVAMDTNYSVDAIYAAITERRKIPKEAKKKLSELHPLAGMAVAYEQTGYKTFEIIEGDRHPQTLIRIVEKEDAEADAVLKEIPWLLIGKNKPEDLTSEVRGAIEALGMEIIHRIRADFNLLAGLDSCYKIGFIKMLLDKKTAPQGGS